MKKLKKYHTKKLEAKLRQKSQSEMRQWISANGALVTERSTLYRKEPVKMVKGGFIVETMVTNMMINSDKGVE